MEPPGGAEKLCILLLRDGGEEEVSRKEVGCQWESPGEEEEERRKEVGCQSYSAETRDAGVQVDLLGQNLSWSSSGETREEVLGSSSCHEKNLLVLPGSPGSASPAAVRTFRSSS